MATKYRSATLLECKPTDEDATVHTTGKPLTLVAYWSALLNIVLGAMLGAMLLSIYLNLINSRLTTTSVNKSTHVPRNCGFTAAEAMARDCEFDLLLVAWVPRECRDYTSADAFTEWVLAPERKPQPFPYFRNEDNTGHIESLRELAEYPGKVYTTLQEHVVHCVFMALHAQRQLQGKSAGGMEWQDFRTTDPELEHQRHCVGMVLHELENRTTHQLYVSPKMGDDLAGTAFRINFEAC
ncbi:hypothetical protein LTR42_001767 [Elasticomyces elasticus]|nr:hypothetical protein LTR42_001767 [Elasticomyces elasticus]